MVEFWELEVGCLGVHPNAAQLAMVGQRKEASRHMVSVGSFKVVAEGNGLRRCLQSAERCCQKKGKLEDMGPASQSSQAEAGSLNVATLLTKCQENDGGG